MSTPVKVSNEHQEFKDSFFIFSTIYICIGYNNIDNLNNNIKILYCASNQISNLKNIPNSVIKIDN